MAVYAGWLLAALVAPAAADWLLAVAAGLLVAVAAELKLWHARGLQLAAAVLLCQGRYLAALPCLMLDTPDSLC